MNQLQIFNFGNQEMRTVQKDGQPWFVLNDVVQVLSLSNSRMVKERLNDDVSSTYPISDSLGRMQDTTIINEDGLYDVILESRKPEARAFRKWVTGEVLPTIRKTGAYSITKLSPELQAIFVHDEKLQVLDNRIGNLENTMTIDYGQQRTLRKLGNKIVMDLVGGKGSVAYKKFGSKAFNELWKHYKNTFDIESYCNTPAIEFERAKEVLKSWRPSEELRYAIIGANTQMVAN